MKRKLFLFVFFTVAVYWTAVYAEETGIGDILVDSTMTISGIAQANGIPEAKLLKGLKLETAEASLKLPETGRSIGQASSVIRKIKVLQATEKAKDWRLILSKFALWIISLTAATVLLMKNKITGRTRLIWMIGTAVLFGFMFGSDPNPMGTVKDAIVLYGREGVLFPPRMAALAVFLLLVFVSNKSICGWGCHFGALQDAVNFSPVRKFKLPFWLTNGIRTIILSGIILGAFARGLDWIGAIDPFKAFNLKPGDIGFLGMIFISLMLLLSLVFYRPWCQLFCPFGLAGWAVEQLSLLSPRISRQECVKCLTCIRVCPTRAMEGIYHQHKLHADCFACGKCLSNCPAKVIKWDRSKKKQ